MRDDGFRVECRGAEHADSVVVREDEVPDRLVGVLAKLLKPALRSNRRGQCLEADDEIFAFDRPDVGIALRRECVDAVGENLEGLLLLAEIGRGCERPSLIIKALIDWVRPTVTPPTRKANL